MSTEQCTLQCGVTTVTGDLGLFFSKFLTSMPLNMYALLNSVTMAVMACNYFAIQKLSIIVFETI